MFAALEESTRAQRQLVADASHELRTPLTSVRTNIEVLADDRTLPPGERERLLDVVEQLGEMTTLISELIELARAEQPSVEPEDVRLDLLVADAVDRARRNRPRSRTRPRSRPDMRGVPSTIDRAVSNLLDNAAKWSPAGAEVEVAVRGGQPVSGTTGRASPTRISRTSSTASTARVPRAACRDRGSGSRSCGRSQSLTAAASWPSTRREERAHGAHARRGAGVGGDHRRRSELLSPLS